MLRVFMLVGLLQLSTAQVCRTLSLEGGGSKGAYEAGAIWALANLSNPEDVKWNVISGISVGSLNTGALIQFPVGQEVQMSEFLLSVWGGVKNNSDVYVEWKLGLIDGLLFQRGLYSTEPLQKLVTKSFINGVQRNFTMGSTNLDLGTFGTFNESLGQATIDSVMCSSAVPFVFPPHIFQGYAWADGACIMNLDVSSAIERCLQITDESNIIVDMIYDDPYAMLGNDTSFKTPDVFMRIYHIRSYDSSIWFTYNAMIAYPKAHYRHIIHPSGKFPGGPIPLNFTQPVIQTEIQMGINDTINALKSEKSGKETIEEIFRRSLNRHIFP